ncbi:M20/M25/M40 family metallo-hydrolase [Streptomyces sp. NPDC058741]|uniref:M20/M25/M40 family metallo-hydrolase n=1 Tax=Streptomyces sp. NPDC058741 TaxID=3346620 RepID=UPI00368F1B19
MNSPSTRTVTDLASKIDTGMDALVQQLTELIRHRSISADGNVSKVRETAQHITALLADAGVEAELIDVGDDGRQHAPLVYADHRCADAAPDTPTVLLYAHYDVHPADGWEEAFTPVVDTSSNRLYGRGAADDKAGIVMHLGAIRAFDGTPPVHLKLAWEGEGEAGRGSLEELVRERPDLFQADVVIVADSGNVRPGVPTLTTSLRGLATMDVTVRTLQRPVHSGTCGGPAPDAFTALVRMLATLHAPDGSIAPELLSRHEWQGAEVSEEQFRDDAHILPDVQLTGAGSVAQRLYADPAINVIGLDGIPPVDRARHSVCDRATARLSIRLSPEMSSASETLGKLRQHLESVRPWNVETTIQDRVVSAGYQADVDKKTFQDAESALLGAYSGMSEVAYTGRGGSLPLVAALQEVNPGAVMLVWGCEEPLTDIHGDGENVALPELRNMTLAEATLFDSLRSEPGTGADRVA